MIVFLLLAALLQDELIEIVTRPSYQRSLQIAPVQDQAREDETSDKLTMPPLLNSQQQFPNLSHAHFYVFKIHVGPGVKGYDPMFSGSNLPKGPTMAKWTRG